MVTDPRQEQMMQLAQAIRQMGMPNPNSRTTDILTQGRVMGGTAMNPYAGTQTGRAPTNLLDIIAMAEAGGQTQLQPSGRGVRGPNSPRTWTPPGPIQQEELLPYGQGGQSPSVLSDLARKNAMRRQVLAKLMGRPTGANSLMELMGQQQPY